MTAEELAELYLEFADPDEANGLRFFEGEELRKRPYLFEVRSVNTVQNLLLQEDRSGNVTLFKTGTSHNRQDAWTIALTKNHIVLAWLGTPDVEPTENLTGRSAAYPLARLIIEAMGLEAPVKRTDVIEDDGVLLKLEACPKLIQFPEDGEWIKSDNLSVSVAGKTGNEWFLNGSPIELGNGAIDLSAPGVLRLTAKNGDCSETVQIFVEIAH
jgi:penicillin-binding protein 1C